MVDYRINSSGTETEVDYIRLVGLALGQKLVVVSVGLVLCSGRLYHISRNSTATEEGCVVVSI